MEEQPQARVVSLGELWDIFVRRLWVMVLVAALAAGGFFGVTQLTYVPRYTSTATLYVLKQNETDTTSASDDFSLALKVVNDCDYLLKSHSVLDEVIDDLKLDVSYEDLSDAVSTSNPDDTRILEVSAEADSPEEAKRIVDAVCRVGTEKITDAMGFQQVNLYEYGTLDPEPSNRTSLSTYALIAVVAAVLTYTAFLVVFLLDDTIRTEEDIQRYLGLTVLGDIPNAEGAGKGHYGYYSSPDKPKGAKHATETAGVGEAEPKRGPRLGRADKRETRR